MFVKGQSGNPSGRPKENSAVKKLAQSHCIAAIEELVRLMKSDDDKIRIQACNAILDRGLGKPAQALIHTGDDDGGPVKIEWPLPQTSLDGK